MSKVIKLKEQDIQRMVKKVLNEQEDRYLGGAGDGETDKIFYLNHLKEERDRLMRVIPYTTTRAEALDIQDDILELDDEIDYLELELGI